MLENTTDPKGSRAAVSWLGQPLSLNIGPPFGPAANLKHVCYMKRSCLLSSQVEIDVDDGIVDDDTVVVVDVVEAAEMGTVTATAEFYDLRLGDTVGCDPAGCTAALTRVCMGLLWSAAALIVVQSPVVRLQRTCGSTCCCAIR